MKILTKLHHKKRLLVLLTVLFILLITLIRTIVLLGRYPEQSYTAEEVCGEGGANLVNITKNGSTLTMDRSDGHINIRLSEETPVYEIALTVDSISRSNCWSYIYLTDLDAQGKTILQEGTNYYTFEDLPVWETTSSIRINPVPVRAVSFNLDSMVINPHGHMIYVQLRSAAILMMVIVLLEILLLELYMEWRVHPQRHMFRIFSVLLGTMQILLGGYFLHYIFGHMTDFTSYELTYYLVEYGMQIVLLDLCFLPAKWKREMPVLRMFLFACYDFAVVESLYSDQYKLTSLQATVSNLLMYAFLYTIMWTLFRKKRGRRLTWVLPTAVAFGIGIANHYFFLFRSQALELTDLTMAATAREVIGNYTFSMSADVLLAILSFVSLIIGLMIEDISCFHRKKLLHIIPSAAFAVITVVYLANNLPDVNLWNTNLGTKYKGYAYSWLGFAAKALQRPTPAGYSAQEAEDTLSQYVVSDEEAAAETGQEKAENIIVIMDEAFADLPTTYNFKTDVDGLPFIHSLEGDNVKKGNLLVSVFGGTTADTEYEFLTGNSVAFLNGESVPYVQYITDKQESLAWTLQERGFQTIAFHPFAPSGYKRFDVYPLMGFEQFISIEDDLPYTNKMRTYVSDEADMKDVIYLYENKEEGKPFFCFNVTMQNHGGYNTSVSAVDVTVHPESDKLDDLVQLQEYLSLAHATDAAFEMLCNYFSEVEENTLIVMFGDHQPGMNDSTYQQICPEMFEDGATSEEIEKKYTVPYVIWANYDLPDDELPVTSPGYLRSFVMKMAGQELTAYDRFTASVREDYPAINIKGFMDKDGNINPIDELDSVPELLDYKKIAYYNLFESESDINWDLFQ